MKGIGAVMALATLVVLLAGPVFSAEPALVNLGLYGGRVMISNSSFAVDGAGNICAVIEGPCGIYRSTDGGANWSRSYVSSTVRGVVVDGTGSFYVADGFTGVVKSTDGVSWTVLTNPAGPAERILRIAVDGSDRLYAASEERLCSSSDGGATWAALSAFPAPGDTQSLAAAVDGSAVWVCHSSVLWKYTASGGLTDIFDPPSLSTAMVTVHPTSPDTLFADDAMYSTDAGASWWTLTHPEGGTDLVSVDPVDTHYYYTGLLKSSDAGDSWTSVGDAQHVMIYGGMSLSCDPNAAGTVYGRNDRGPVKSAEFGDNWTQLVEGIDSQEVQDACRSESDPDLILVGSFHGLARSPDDGASWSWITAGDTNVTAVDILGPTAYSVCARGVYWSSDTGATFTQLTTNFDGDITDIYIAAGGDAYFAASQHDAETPTGGIWRFDGSWSPLTTGSIPVNAITRSGGVFYAGVGDRDGDAPGGILASPDGTSWTQFTALAAECVWSLAVYGPDIYAGAGSDVAGGGSVWFSHDTGATWSESTLGISSTGRVMALLIDADATTTLYAAIDNRVYRSEDSGSTWSLYYEDEEGVAINVLMYPSGSGLGRMSPVRGDDGEPLFDLGSRTGIYAVYAPAATPPTPTAPPATPTPAGKTPTPPPTAAPATPTPEAATPTPAAVPPTPTAPSAPTPVPPPTPVRLILDAADFDGAGGDDLGLWRAFDASFRVRNVSTVFYGVGSDIPVTGDYNGDGAADYGVFRPSTGRWWVRGLYTGSTPLANFYFGTNGDIPVPADYDGDFRTDTAVWRPLNGYWAVKSQTRFYYGARNDLPVPGDYNGDGRADPAVFRPAATSGVWYVRGITQRAWGLAGDGPAPGDYNGDGTTELSVFRGYYGRWYALGSPSVLFGQPGDIPVVIDFEGDGTEDRVLYRQSEGRWYVYGVTAISFGSGPDQPAVGRTY